ncbi:hypothetical protein BaRGS_00014872 [Batillaria attramentaria]|uniref:Uncharacterized protein n=1 Tax=Batillaria attramentaria TaxID=370345 RepID=A0ABD0L4C1_9CAEN
MHLWQTEEGTLKLTGGSRPWDGRLEVYYSGEWGTVCDDGFGLEEAGVACWQLGFSRASSNYSTVGVDSSNPPILLDDLHCDGTELTLAQSDPCRDNPCLNAGTCIPEGDTNATCSCDRAHTGRLCEIAPSVQVNCGRTMEVAFPREAWPGLQEKYVTLLNASCSATGNATHVTVLIPHDGCGTSTQAILDGYVFENQVITRDVAVNGLISRVRDVHMTVHCHYHGQAMLENFYIVNTGLIRFSDVASGHYKLSMDLFHNGHEFVGQPQEMVEPGEDLSLRLSLSSNDSSLEVFARNCRATPTQDNTLSQYLFLDEGSSLVLHCDVLVCNVTDSSNRCNQGCLSGQGGVAADQPEDETPRARRNVQDPGNTKYGATGRAADWNVCRLPLLALFCLMATTVSTQLLART